MQSHRPHRLAKETATVMNTMTESSLGGEGYLAYTFMAQSTKDRLQDWRWELRQKPEKHC